MYTAIGLIIPFAGTSLGAAMVFLMRNKMNPHVEKLLLGFASGVMVAASVWSLLIPSIEMSGDSSLPAWLPPAIGFLLGIGFLLLLDTVTPHIHLNSDKPEGPRTHLKKTTMLVFAVTLHNIPEGMAVGVTFAGAMTGNTGITIAGALALSIGIAIQNFPEGTIISMPLKSEGMINIIVPALPYILAFAAGAMIYVVVEELIPESQSGEHSNIGTIGVALGFVIMMILDVALG